MIGQINDPARSWLGHGGDDNSADIVNMNAVEDLSFAFNDARRAIAGFDPHRLGIKPGKIIFVRAAEPGLATNGIDSIKQSAAAGDVEAMQLDEDFLRSLVGSGAPTPPAPPDVRSPPCPALILP